MDAHLILHIFRVTIYTKQMATAESKGFGVVDRRVEADTALEGSVRRGAAIFREYCSLNRFDFEFR